MFKSRLLRYFPDKHFGFDFQRGTSDDAAIWFETEHHSFTGEMLLDPGNHISKGRDSFIEHVLMPGCGKEKQQEMLCYSPRSSTHRSAELKDSG